MCLDSATSQEDCVGQPADKSSVDQGAYVCNNYFGTGRLKFMLDEFFSPTIRLRMCHKKLHFFWQMKSSQILFAVSFETGQTTPGGHIIKT